MAIESERMAGEPTPAKEHEVKPTRLLNLLEEARQRRYIFTRRALAISRLTVREWPEFPAYDATLFFSCMRQVGSRYQERIHERKKRVCYPMPVRDERLYSVKTRCHPTRLVRVTRRLTVNLDLVTCQLCLAALANEVESKLRPSDEGSLL